MAQNYEHEYPDVRPGGTSEMFAYSQANSAWSDNYDRAKEAARKHSSRVRLLKWILPISGLAVALVLVLMTFLSGISDHIDLSGLALTTDGIVMDNPKLSGHDGKSRGYEVTATRAIQSITNPSLITLENIKARLDIGNGDSIELTARNGQFDRKTEILDLSGDIRVVANSGYTARIETARIDVKKGTIKSDSPIAIDSKGGNLAADRLSAENGGRSLVFGGNVRMTLYPEHLKNGVAK